MVTLVLALIIIWIIVSYVLVVSGFSWYYIIIAFPVIAFVLIGIYIGYSPRASKLTGFNGYRSTSTETITYGTPPRQRTITREENQPGKTLWDWLQLFIIPLALAVVLFGLGAKQGEQSQKFSEQLNNSQLQFAQASFQNSVNQQQDSTLQSYEDRMADLMIYNNLSQSKPSDPVRAVARIRTLSTLLQLDANHKRGVLIFLYQGRLIDKFNTIVSLSLADLSHANLNGLNLSGANLSGSDLSHANLSQANLSGADLTGAIMPDGSKHS